MHYLQLLGLVKVTTGTYINVNTPELISGKNSGRAKLNTLTTGTSLNKEHMYIMSIQ